MPHHSDQREATPVLDRRGFLRAGLGAAALVALPRTLQAVGRSTDLPNIVYILADDLGYGDPRCYNQDSKIPTPNIDRLAAGGVRFTDAHSPSSVCTPTRYGILTGRYAWRTRLKSSVLWTWDPPLIEPGRLTVPTLLKRHGYDTACIGKWHLGWNWPTTDDKRPKRDSPAKNVDFTRPITGGPLEYGFDYYFGDDVPNFPPYCFIENDRTLGIPTQQKPKEMFGHPGPMLPGWDLTKVMPRLTEEAVGYIDARAQDSRRPFFLYFALTAPHTPIAPLPQFAGKSSAGAYGDFVHEVDWAIGQIMVTLERAGLAEDTLLIVTSDNGSPARDGANMSGPTGSVKKYGHYPSGQWRGMKSDTWEGGHRVPFIARWPRKIKPGSVCDGPICLSDLLATCAALVGDALPNDGGEDSYNVLPYLLGEPQDRPIREAIVHHSGNGMFAIRQGDWKLILGRGSGGFTKPSRVEPKPGEPVGQLYNLAEDPAEAQNLYLQRPDVVDRLTKLLEKYKAEGRSRPG